MKRILLQSVLMSVLALLLGSCGELFENPPVIEAKKMHLDREYVVIMKEDTCRLNMVFTPDSVTIESAFWTSENPCVKVSENGLVTAVEVGETKVSAISVTSRLEDTCRVKVVPKWDLNSYDFLYEMVVYANVTVGGVSQPEDIRVAAICNDEIRGEGEVMEHNGKKYTRIRIYSNTESGEKIEFYCYNSNKNIYYHKFPFELTFDGETHGTLSDLIDLTLP